MSNRIPTFHPRKLLLPLVALAAGSMLVAGQAPNSTASDQRQAAGTCTLNVPATVEIADASYDLPLTLGADCAAAGVIEAKWEAMDAAGKVMNKAFFNFNKPTNWALYDGVTLGTMTWQPTGARGVVNPAAAKTGQTPSVGSNNAAVPIVEIPQNTPKTDVRARSVVYNASPDRGTNPCILHLKMYGERYDPTSDPVPTDGMIDYAGGRGSFQQLQRGSTTWTSISGATLSSTGQMQINIPWPKVITHYRKVLYATATTWGSTTPLWTENPKTGC